MCDATSCVMSHEEMVVYHKSVEDGTWTWPPSGTKIKKLPRECFDRILLDGPCSAMGNA